MSLNAFERLEKLPLQTRWTPHRRRAERSKRATGSGFTCCAYVPWKDPWARGGLRRGRRRGCQRPCGFFPQAGEPPSGAGQRRRAGVPPQPTLPGAPLAGCLLRAQRTRRRGRSPPTVAKIERDMNSRWHDGLYFLTGSDEAGRSILPARVVKHMEESVLTRPATQAGRVAPRITVKGYEFMLKEAHVQGWMVVYALINDHGRTQPCFTPCIPLPAQLLQGWRRLPADLRAARPDAA